MKDNYIVDKQDIFKANKDRELQALQDARIKDMRQEK